MLEPKSCPICGRLVAYGQSCSKCGCPVHNKALCGAFTKGFMAALDENCPYHDLRNHTGRITYSRAFVRAWEAGRSFRGSLESDR